MASLHLYIRSTENIGVEIGDILNIMHTLYFPTRFLKLISTYKVQFPFSFIKSYDFLYSVHFTFFDEILAIETTFDIFDSRNIFTTI